MRWQQQQNAVKLGDEGEKISKKSKKKPKPTNLLQTATGKEQKTSVVNPKPTTKKRAEIA
jgi:hypothetical protein